jgi:23S rRNA (cytidine1920-2'-O)/16S rRNA (cytidine1409-2'-O)-methyltransferase
MAAEKKRLDKYLVDAGLSASREKAQREIVSGWVKVNGETIRDVSHNVFGSEDFSVERPGGLFVSRGGEKLARALQYFTIDVKNAICADLGASTGGFTDCLLKNGAAKVYAVDVGYGQLDYSLRTDSRVVVMERLNARALEPSMFDDKVNFLTADLSFISFTKVYESIVRVFGAVQGVALIKPQFEADKSEHKKGVVVKSGMHVDILSRTIDALVQKGLCIKGLTHSPIKGPKGNIEFLLYFATFDDHAVPVDIEKIVHDAHSELSASDKQ